MVVNRVQSNYGELLKHAVTCLKEKEEELEQLKLKCQIYEDVVSRQEIENEMLVVMMLEKMLKKKFDDIEKAKELVEFSNVRLALADRIDRGKVADQTVEDLKEEIHDSIIFLGDYIEEFDSDNLLLEDEYNYLTEINDLDEVVLDNILEVDQLGNSNVVHKSKNSNKTGKQSKHASKGGPKKELGNLKDYLTPYFSTKSEKRIRHNNHMTKKPIKRKQANTNEDPCVKKREYLPKMQIETVSDISELIPGSTMFYKLKGHPHWPVRIVSVSNERGAEFKYFGTNEIGFARNTKNLHPYSEKNKKIFWDKGIKNKKLLEAIAKADQDI